MRLAAAGIVSAAIALALSGCVNVEPEDAAARAVAGAALGSALGAGLGATVAINPLLGASIGAQSGAVVGAAIGVATTQRAPSYRSLTVPAEPIVPGFYDAWPPGYTPPPPQSQVAPPRPS